MNRTSFLIIAWCMMCISACTTQQKENVGTLPVVDFEQEYPEESFLTLSFFRQNSFNLPCRYL